MKIAERYMIWEASSQHGYWLLLLHCHWQPQHELRQVYGPGKIHTMTDELYASLNTECLNAKCTVKKTLTAEHDRNTPRVIPNVQGGYMKSQREDYLDGMKGLACLFILLGHFTGIYKYADNASQIDSWFVRILTKGPFSFFTTESFWLYLFFVISGYLSIISPPKNNRDFFAKCIKRILRLAIPILGTAIFIFIIQNVIGFHNYSVQAIIQNTWLTHLYGNRLTILDILKEPFLVLVLGISKFNSPFWCLRDMLISSFLIYGVCLICKSKKTKTIVVCVLILLAAITNKIIIMACLCGSCAGLLKEYIYIYIVKNTLLF